MNLKYSDTFEQRYKCNIFTSYIKQNIFEQYSDYSLFM